MKTKRKCLFVGDLRPGWNFGAIATSTELMEIARATIDGDDFSAIDSRSFNGLTPVGGLKPFVPPSVPFGVIEKEGRSKFELVRKSKEFIKTSFKAVGLGGVIDSVNRLPQDWAGFEKGGEEVKAGNWLPYEAKLISESDYVVVNAEGSIVHNIHNVGGKYRPGARYMLFMAYLAKVVYGKPTAIINHIIDPDHEGIKDVITRLYPKLDFVAVRDPISVQNLKALGFEGAEFVPDALFNYHPDSALLNSYDGWDFFKPKRGPFICIGDAASIPYVPWSIEEFFPELFRRLRERGCEIVFADGESLVSKRFKQICKSCDVPRITTYNTSYEQFASVLQASDVFFSGRWHASILATLGGTPSVLFGTDSHKTRVLHEMVGARSPFFDVKKLPEQMDDIVSCILSEAQSSGANRPSLLQVADSYTKKTQRYAEIVSTLRSRAA